MTATTQPPIIEPLEESLSQTLLLNENGEDGDDYSAVIRTQFHAGDDKLFETRMYSHEWVKVTLKDYESSSATSRTSSQATNETTDSAKERLNAEDFQADSYTSAEARLVENQKYIEALGASKWKVGRHAAPVKTPNGDDAILLLRPTASNMNHNYLNPYFYRGARQLRGLDDFAQIINAPADWLLRYQQVIRKQSRNIKSVLVKLMAHDAQDMEPSVEACFVSLIFILAQYLNVSIRQQTFRKVIVGGMLADPRLDFISEPNFAFVSLSGVSLIATECKTIDSWKDNSIWFQSSRGVQVLAALYAYQSPVFLYNSRQWKLLVLSQDRTQIFTFPYGDTEAQDGQNDAAHDIVSSAQVANLNNEFVQALALCLMAAPLQQQVEEADDEIKLFDRTPKKHSRPEDQFRSVEKKQKESVK